jgi:predicted CoA-binding protein
MKHMHGEEELIAGLLRSTRTIAVVGASARPSRHSRAVVSYLHESGYDVIPVRPDRAMVAGLPSYARLGDIRGAIDLVVIFRRPGAVADHIHEAATRRAVGVWLPPGTWSRLAADTAHELQIELIVDRCIIREHSHLLGALGEPGAGHPAPHRVRK